MRTFPTILFLALAACASVAPGSTSPAAIERTLLFADEFDTGSLDRSTWSPIGNAFWVNDEQQAYVDDPRTIGFAEGIAGADSGVLVLRPVWAPGEDTRADRNADFISGRIESEERFEFTYGRAEARIRMPDATGVWPAWWALGNGQWPGSGEIDIMEYVGEPEWTGVALHGPGYSGETPIVNRFTFDDGTDVTDWHVYAVEWTREAISFQIDGRETYRASRAMVEHYGEWRFDTPKYLILNFALGGAYPGKVNGITQPYYGLPQSTVDRIRAGEEDLAMYVDWVRVYAPE